MSKFWMLFFGILFSGQLFAQLNIEMGSVWQAKNEFRRPTDTGTKVDLLEFSKGPFNHYRIEYHHKVSGPHGFRVIYAPFRVELNGILSENVNFDGQSFSQGVETEAVYQFNSYRLGYTYDYTPSIKIGFTAKLRDAEIALRQGSLSSSTGSGKLGFVPLLYVSYTNQLSQNWTFFTDLDAAASPQGRAFDLAVKFRRDFTEKSYLGLGYRTIEGGSDGTTAYTFSWFNYAVFEYGYKF